VDGRKLDGTIIPLPITAGRSITVKVTIGE
jgi:hypothetical protein